MSMFAELGEVLARAWDAFAGLEVRVAPVHVVGTVVIGYAVFRLSGAAGSFLAWLFPARIYLHRSHIVDLKLFVLGRALAMVGFLNAFTLTVVTAAVVMHAVGGNAEGKAAWNPLLIALLLMIANDFTVYWVHRLHHEMPALWPFHSVHHSAEVMTPITVYRKHPVYDVVSQIMRGLVLGLVQGLLLGLFVSQVDLALIAGVNAVYVAFNFFGANLRHSHIWLSYGPWVERILMSPAQHQVHHSIELKHRNKNYGEILALWDWLFGTLYVTRDREELIFGLSDEEGRPVPQPHGSLREALVRPFVDCCNRLGGGRKRPAATDAPAGS